MGSFDVLKNVRFGLLTMKKSQNENDRLENDRLENDRFENYCFLKGMKLSYDTFKKKNDRIRNDSFQKWKKEVVLE